ncbi:MAG: hypothetical protein BJ554DRAFT_1561, partial [Olpidium bornovanus]
HGDSWPVLVPPLLRSGNDFVHRDPDARLQCAGPERKVAHHADEQRLPGQPLVSPPVLSDRLRRPAAARVRGSAELRLVGAQMPVFALAEEKLLLVFRVAFRGFRRRSALVRDGVRGRRFVAELLPGPAGSSGPAARARRARRGRGDDGPLPGLALRLVQRPPSLVTGAHAGGELRVSGKDGSDGHAEVAGLRFSPHQLIPERFREIGDVFQPERVPVRVVSVQLLQRHVDEVTPDGAAAVNKVSTGAVPPRRASRNCTYHFGSFASPARGGDARAAVPLLSCTRNSPISGGDLRRLESLSNEKAPVAVGPPVGTSPSPAYPYIRFVPEEASECASTGKRHTLETPRASCPASPWRCATARGRRHPLTSSWAPPPGQTPAEGGNTLFRTGSADYSAACSGRSSPAGSDADSHRSQICKDPCSYSEPGQPCYAGTLGRRRYDLETRRSAAARRRPRQISQNKALTSDVSGVDTFANLFKGELKTAAAAQPREVSDGTQDDVTPAFGGERHKGLISTSARSARKKADLQKATPHVPFTSPPHTRARAGASPLPGTCKGAARALTK